VGVMTDFFLASATDVEKVLNGWQLPSQPAQTAADRMNRQYTPESGWHQPPKPNPNANPAPQIASLPNVQCRGMLPDKLALLFAALAEVPPDRALELILHGYLTGPPETEVTVQQLPVALTKALAAAADADLVRAAKVLEEDDIESCCVVFRGKLSELTDVLQRVQSLAKHGLSTNADLFLWTCT
jgi:hypothetical protein